MPHLYWVQQYNYIGIFSVNNTSGFVKLHTSWKYKLLIRKLVNRVTFSELSMVWIGPWNVFSVTLLGKKMDTQRHRNPLKLIVRIFSPNNHSQRDFTFSGLYRGKLCWHKVNFELPRLNFEPVRVELWTFTVLKCFPETSVIFLSRCFLMWFGVAVQLPRLFGCVAVSVFYKVFYRHFCRHCFWPCTIFYISEP